MAQSLALSEILRNFDLVEDTHVDCIYLNHDSTKHASMMVLAALSVRK